MSLYVTQREAITSDITQIDNLDSRIDEKIAPIRAELKAQLGNSPPESYALAARVIEPECSIPSQESQRLSPSPW